MTRCESRLHGYPAAGIRAVSSYRPLPAQKVTVRRRCAGYNPPLLLRQQNWSAEAQNGDPARSFRGKSSLCRSSTTCRMADW